MQAYNVMITKSEAQNEPIHRHIDIFNMANATKKRRRRQKTK